MLQASACMFSFIATVSAELPWRVACIGDSITRGDASHESGKGDHSPNKSKAAGRGNYPLLLGRLLGSDFVVRNFGRGGCSVENTTGRCCRGYHIWREALSWAPDVVVLMVGTNDAKDEVWDARKFDGSFKRMLHELLKLPSQPIVIVVAPPPVMAPSKNAFGIDEGALKGKVIPKMRDLVASLRAERNQGAAFCQRGSLHWHDLHLDPELAPCAEGDRERCAAYYVADQIHTSERGAAVIADRVWSLLKSCRPASQTLQTGSDQGRG